MTPFRFYLLLQSIPFVLMMGWIGWLKVVEWLDWKLLWEHVDVISRQWPDNPDRWNDAFFEFQRW